MRIYSLHRTRPEPVSHDPSLEKRVLVREGIPGIKDLSHALLKRGDRASRHCHQGEFEVLYCIKGALLFEVEGREVEVGEGDCIVIEPGEAHSIPSVVDETELLYFKVPCREG